MSLTVFPGINSPVLIFSRLMWRDICDRSRFIYKTWFDQAQLFKTNIFLVRYTVRIYNFITLYSMFSLNLDAYVYIYSTLINPVTLNSHEGTWYRESVCSSRLVQISPGSLLLLSHNDLIRRGYNVHLTNIFQPVHIVAEIIMKYFSTSSAAEIILFQFQTWLRVK